MNVHLVDGTYELFRHHYGLPEDARNRPGTNGAVRGVLNTLYYLLEEGATHVGVATDHVIESFRNDMWRGYKSSAGMDPLLLAQFPVLEEGIDAMGIKVFPMVELEADDALASAAAVAADDDRVDEVLILTPDKDLGQCVKDGRIVQLDRRKRPGIRVDEAGVRAKFGVDPESVPDYLALVGDSADGFPGLPGFGAKTAAAVLSRYRHLEDIPADGREWDVPRSVRGVIKLAETLVEQRDLAYLFRRLATLEIDRDLVGNVDELEWRGPTDEFEAFCERVDAGPLAKRAVALATARS